MGNRSRGGGRRTDYAWGNVGDSVVAQPIGSTAIFGVTAFDFNLAGTLMRVRGKVGVQLDQGGVDENALILCGLMELTNDAFVGGNAPELFTSTSDEASWIWQGSLYVSSGETGSTGDSHTAAVIEIDTKAMRRIKPASVLAFVHQSPVELAQDQGGTYDLVYYLHILVGS